MARNTRLQAPFDLTAWAFIATTGAACAQADPVQGDGSLRVGLWGEGASGARYHLSDAGFHITGDGVEALVTAADEPDGTPSLSIPLAAGHYELELLPGWEVYRGSIGDPQPAQVVADLITPNPVEFAVADNFSTEVTYMFEIEGDLVPMSDGTLDIDVEFQEDDGICTTSAHDWLFLGGDGHAPVGQGDGWQSFTASGDSLAAFILLFWEAGAPAGTFTLNLYEGVGTAGTLLSSGDYLVGEQAIAGFLWFGQIPVPLSDGQSYTFEAVNAPGWRTESGALPGATSSHGDAFHKTMRVYGPPCD